MNSFRTKLLAAFLLVVLAAIGALALLTRAEMSSRFTAQYEAQVETLVQIIEEDLERQGNLIEASLSVIRRSVVDDNRFRRATVDRAPDERAYLLNYAENVLRLSGLDMLQIQNEEGRIVSSGHFRNEYDRIEGSLPKLLAGRSALVRARTPDAPFIALARVDSFRMGSRYFRLVGGRRVEQRFLSRLARGTDMVVELEHPRGRLSSMTEEDSPDEVKKPVTGSTQPGDSAVTPPHVSNLRELTVPFIDSDRGVITNATFRVTHGTSSLEALRKNVDRWFLMVFLVAGGVAAVLVAWLAGRISRPLAELARKTSRIDLDRLDVRFQSSRKDEIGDLSRMLGSMTGRLRSGKVLLQKAEREATRGELARQVNHDVKNGLTPIRNVFRHLSELASEKPEELPGVFVERSSTLNSSITYLENLASNYARLSPRTRCIPCDVNTIVTGIVRDLRARGRYSLNVELGEQPFVLGDPVSLRRIVENLVTNGIESLESHQGSVTVSTALIPAEEGRPGVRITVTDTGRGMTEDLKSKVFDDFYSTKETGTGLGLSIVRRLIMDMDGSIQFESRVGAGSSFQLDLPGVHPDEESRSGSNKESPAGR